MMGRSGRAVPAWGACADHRPMRGAGWAPRPVGVGHSQASMVSRSTREASATMKSRRGVSTTAETWTGRDGRNLNSLIIDR